MHDFLLCPHYQGIQDLLWLMVAEAWAVGNTTGHQYRKNVTVRSAYGAQQPGRDQAWTRPRRSAQRYLLQSLQVSIPSIYRSETYKDQDRHKRYQRPTCLLGTLQPRTLSRPYLPSVLLSDEKHTRLNLAYSDWSVYEFSQKNTIESINGVFGCAVNSTYLSDYAGDLSMGTYLLSMVLDRRLSLG
jgi:hypothetical protein